MTTLIQHDDLLDLEALANLARACEQFVSDATENPIDFDPENPSDAALDALADWDLDVDDLDEARATVEALDSMLNDLGIRPEPGCVADELDDIARNYERTLIAEDYFQTYAEELASDLGAIDPDARWPLNHIDWKAAAEELATDYSAVTLDGENYLIRSW